MSITGMEKAKQWIEEAKKSGSTLLELSDLELTELPEGIGNLTSLQWLDLNNNGLTQLPEVIGNLTSLQRLDLNNNGLTQLPEAITKITSLQTLDLSVNGLTQLPEAITKITSLQTLDLDRNRLTELPEAIGNLTSLQRLDLDSNRLTELPEAIGNLTSLHVLYLQNNGLTQLPEAITKITSLQRLHLSINRLTELPEAIGNLTSLQTLDLKGNRLTELPEAIGNLTSLTDLDLDSNPLHPDLKAAYDEGIPALFAYLKSRAKEQSQISEVKLILVGEGAVGKSCLLDALAGNPWQEYDSTHGIRIESFEANHPDSGEVIHFNGWDFGGQKVYKPTHQLFFSSPAVYLVVWKPRDGPEQSRVEEWIALVKLREPDAKIFVVATHGGPRERQPDIDRQEIFDKFGRETVLDFFHVESKPDEASGERRGIEALKCAILREASRILDASGRERPAEWQRAWEALVGTGKPYVTMDEVCDACTAEGMDVADTQVFIQVWHNRGRLIHYTSDALLESIVILRPDWLTQAISYVLDDRPTRESLGLIGKSRLRLLWDDPSKGEGFRYGAALHDIFIRLLARYDLAYPIALPPSRTPVEETLLVAQLVDDIRPEEKLHAAWPSAPQAGEEEKEQVCRIVARDTGQSAGAEGLFYQLIVRLHRYSLGRKDYYKSVHWKRGLVIEHGYNGRARLEHVGNDIHITVRAPDPHRFLSILAEDVKYLVESFWEGLECQVAIPCPTILASGASCIGLFEIEALLESVTEGRNDYPCSVCRKWHSIDALLYNATSAPKESGLAVLDGIDQIKAELGQVRGMLFDTQGQIDQGVRVLALGIQAAMSRADAQYDNLMRTLADEAKDGPRLFSIVPIDPKFLDRPNWIGENFQLTLWCEHSRQPLPLLDPDNPARGVYRISLTREWLAKLAPWLKGLNTVLGLVVPVAAAAGKAFLDEAVFKGIEKELDFGGKALDAYLKGGEKASPYLERSDAKGLMGAGELSIYAEEAVFRQLQELLRAKDKTFGGLAKVIDNQGRVKWVHPKFKGEYFDSRPTILGEPVPVEVAAAEWDGQKG